MGAALELGATLALGPALGLGEALALGEAVSSWATAIAAGISSTATTMATDATRRRIRPLPNPAGLLDLLETPTEQSHCIA